MMIGGRDHVGGRRTGERGAVLIVSLLLTLMTMAWMASIGMAAVALQQRERYARASRMARFAAESGIHHAVGEMAGLDADAFLDAGGMQGTLRGTGARALRYEVTILEGAADGIDNDVDGAIDEADEVDTYEITSVGRSDHVARTVRVTLIRPESLSINAAAYFMKPDTEVTVSGGAALSGDEHDAEGVWIGEGVHALGVNGDATYILDNLDRNKLRQITGLGGPPSIANLPAPSADVMERTYQNAAMNAEVTFINGADTDPLYEGHWGTANNPKLFYGTGSVKLSASSGIGYGTLVVDGDLTMSGSFEWRGLVIVSGDITFSGGGKGLRLVGAVISAPRDPELTAPKVTFSGGVAVRYAGAVTATSSAGERGAMILNWREVATPE